MTDTAVKTNALEAKITSLVSVGVRLVKLATDERLDDDREVIGDIATAMTNVRTEVTAVSRKLDVVQRNSQQREYERDVARQQARDAEALLEREAADSRIMMRVMAVGCVVVCVATGFAARWWYGRASVVAVVEQRALISAPPVPFAGGLAAKPTAGEAARGETIATPQAGGDYACAFAYGRPAGQRCR